MNRREITEEVNQQWFHGAAFAGAVHDPEFQEIAQRFLCGDITGQGALTDVCQRQCDFVVFRRTGDVEKWRVKVYSLSWFVFRKKKRIENFASAFCNAGFIGIPLAQATIGEDGVFLSRSPLHF